MYICVVWVLHVSYSPKPSYFTSIYLTRQCSLNAYLCSINNIKYLTNIYFSFLCFFIFILACGGELISEEGLFSSPQYPDSYPVSVECVWIVAASPGTNKIIRRCCVLFCSYYFIAYYMYVFFLGNQVTLTFNTFDLDESENCDEDFVEIRESNSSGPILGKWLFFYMF